jgi:hypothetical protein
MITGHHIKGTKTTCMKCGSEKHLPITRWAIGLAVIFVLVAVAVWANLTVLHWVSSIL